MSKTLRDAIEIVVSTTMSDGRIDGIVTFQKRCQALVPSSCAASTCSIGTPLIDAESTTIAKPVCTQISTTMSRKLLRGTCCNQLTGSPPNSVTIPLSTPI